MGTRGFIGLVADGTEKITYNHSDSYPGGLGNDVLTWLRRVVAVELGVHTARDSVRALRVVSPESTPSAEDIERLRPWTDLNVGQQSTDDWYCLLRGTQGNPAEMLAAGVIEDASHFPADSLFAEWGYVVDFDHNRFEVYRGFVKAPHTGERFSDRPRRPDANGYYPVQYVMSWGFDELPSSEEFVRLTEGADRDDDDSRE